MSFSVVRREISDAVRELGASGLLPFGLGCVSAVDRERGMVVVAPAGVPAAGLTPEALLVMDLAGKVVDGGALKSAPDAAAHCCLYQEFSEIGAIVNHFGPYAVRFAQAERPIPCLGIIHARTFKGDIPVTRALRKPEVERNYERSIGAVIAERFARLDALRIPGVLVARHGAYAWGRSLKDALSNSVTLEKVAELAYGSLLLAPQVESLSGMLLDKHFASNN